MPDAIGIVETYGYVAAMKAADAAAKAADVKIIAIDTNRPANPKDPVPLIGVVKMQGTVAAVKAAVEAADNTVDFIFLKMTVAELSEIKDCSTCPIKIFANGRTGIPIMPKNFVPVLRSCSSISVRIALRARYNLDFTVLSVQSIICEISEIVRLSK